MKKKFTTVIGIFLIVALLVGCGGNTEEPASVGNGEATVQPQTWRFVHEEVPGSVQDEYAQKFKQLVEAKTEGAVTVEVYPVGQLGDAVQQVELLQNGGVEFAITNPSSVGTVVRESQLFYLHFVLSDDMRVNQEVLSNSPAMDELNQVYLERGIQVLDWFPEGFMMWTADRPLRTPADMRGFKMRTMPSPLIVAAYEAYGANPTPVPYMEVYSSLQLNMIDGQVNPIFAIEEMKFYEVQDYLVLSKQDVFVASTVVNPDFWNGLSQELKDMIIEILPELNEHVYQVQEDLNDSRLEAIRQVSDIEIIELTDEEREAFREASIPVRDEFARTAGERGEKILNQLIEDIKAAEER